ncbi:hypothetical protein SAMN04487911_10935 [Arenibacter nanhaiticus]|uniref:Uncharacterized protein n=1 Tax=Arenibacter nanhaiticus TaxID=558155 RepID=A0A1M6FPE0_9FLAO|nr:hypothetical protein [Arenibacter nanhaiticus]SHI99533.1 hypothetical protein SAMN04487911_10935 [Arenibacter nanhaiticus]
MKKKITLMVNEPLKQNLESKVQDILNEITDLKTDLDKGIDYDTNSVDKVIKFIRTYGNDLYLNDEVKQNEIILIKYRDEVQGVRKLYPSLIKLKAIEMFKNPEDVTVVKNLIQRATGINKEIESIKGLTLESFVLNEEFKMNTKVDTVLKEIYSTFCKNTKQNELKQLAEKLSTIIEWGLKQGIVSKHYTGINLSEIIDLDTGKVDYNRIASIR